MTWVRSTLPISPEHPSVVGVGTNHFSPGCRMRMEHTRCSGEPWCSVVLEWPPNVLWGFGDQSWGAGSKTAWLAKLSSSLVFNESCLLQVDGWELHNSFRDEFLTHPSFPKSCFQSHSAPGLPLLNQCQMNKQSLMNVLFSLSLPHPLLLSPFGVDSFPSLSFPHVDFLSL